MENKIAALAKYLEVEEDEIEIYDEERSVLSCCGDEYIVLTDEEADRAAHDSIRDLLWAFRARFLASYIDNGDDFAEFIEAKQEKECEGCNEAIYRLVGDRFDDLVDDAIRDDGRGHFIGQYDHEENECGKYFIYRQ